MQAQRIFSNFSQDDVLSCHPLEEVEGVGRESGSVVKLPGPEEGGGVDHVPQSTLRNSRGNKGGLFSLCLYWRSGCSRLFLAI